VFHSARNKLPILKVGLTDAEIMFDKVCVHPSHFECIKTEEFHVMSQDRAEQKILVDYTSCDHEEGGDFWTKISGGPCITWWGRTFLNEKHWWTLHHVIRVDLFDPASHWNE
jgi:hypothetical protein